MGPQTYGFLKPCTEDDGSGTIGYEVRVLESLGGVYWEGGEFLGDPKYALDLFQGDFFTIWVMKKKMVV